MSHEHDPLDSPYGRALEELTRAAEQWARHTGDIGRKRAELERLKDAARAFVLEETRP